MKEYDVEETIDKLGEIFLQWNYGDKGQIAMELSGYTEDEEEEIKADWLWIGPVFRRNSRTKAKVYKLSDKHKHWRQEGDVVSKNNRAKKFPSESRAYEERL